MKSIKLLVGLVLMVEILFSFTYPQPLPKGSMARGKKVYETYCLACHQADGSGVQRMNPPLIRSEYVSGDTKRLINIVLQGLNEEIEIDGDTYSTPMPAQGHLNDREIADVLTYIRNSFGNKGKSIDPVQVNTERKKLK
ncbi:c-type cytochrome [Flavihumibacter fluvii]|uniref:c-type cytochrome n=1 Tax=Flavihumibacter fluvii TaxID=2838157 RepID=UPI001BDF20CA|nr:cytochrome c [Flavihumibacter fluvii]ULQ53588.1 cytochrome c [Flavihumibacter fluvii]